MIMFPKRTPTFKWTLAVMLVMLLSIVCTAHVATEKDDRKRSSNSEYPLDNTAGITVNCPEIPKCPAIPKIPACPKCPAIPKCPDIPKHHELPQSCKDVSSLNPRPVVTLSNGLKVMCDTQTDGGGWTIFQRRIRGDEDFYRGWNDYKFGFGNMEGGEFWLGNEILHQITIGQPQEMRVDLTYNEANYYATYSTFRVSGEEDNYKLEVGGYSGTAGDSMASHHSMGFTTKERDNDGWSPVDDKKTHGNCAQYSHGAWWYNGCHNANLNGEWGARSDSGMEWVTLADNDPVSFTEMKLRPVS